MVKEALFGHQKRTTAWGDCGGLGKAREVGF
jgi:hypothetical protein